MTYEGNENATHDRVRRYLKENYVDTDDTPLSQHVAPSTKAIFTRLYIDADEGSRPIVASDELNEHVAPLVHAARHHIPDLWHNRKAAHTRAADATHTNCADHPQAIGRSRSAKCPLPNS